MNITQNFYDNMAAQHDKLFLDRQATTRDQGDGVGGSFSEPDYEPENRQESQP